MNVSAVPDPATYTSGGALHDPSPLLTVTCAVAALDRAGVTHVTSPDDTHVPRTSSTAFSSANRTRRFVDLTKPRPRIVTVVPPETCPFGGSSRVIRGGRARRFEGAPSPENSTLRLGIEHLAAVNVPKLHDDVPDTVYPISHVG